MDEVLLSKYFKDENIVAKEDQLEAKPSAKGLINLKKKLGLKDWEMLYIGDGYDDYLAAKDAKVFFAMIAQGLVNDISTISQMKKDAEFGASTHRAGKTQIPRFIVAFTFDELIWWFHQISDFRKQIKAVCFDLGDTLVIGGREEAYSLADKNWPTWDVDSMLEENKKTDKKIKESIMNLKIENKWRKLGDLPAMNSSEVRITAYFLLRLFDLKEKDLVSVLYSELDDSLKNQASELAKATDLSLNMATIPEGTSVKELSTLFPSKQFSLFIASGLMQTLKKEKREPRKEEVALVLKSAFLWIGQYRKYEVEAYRKHCKIPKGLKEFLDLLTKKKKHLCIYTSKSRKIVETALAYKKEIASK
jgi:phosphoglycolate phosphatase-like HAD superfamily hydrolase